MSLKKNQLFVDKWAVRLSQFFIKIRFFSTCHQLIKETVSKKSQQTDTTFYQLLSFVDSTILCQNITKMPIKQNSSLQESL